MHNTHNKLNKLHNHMSKNKHNNKHTHNKKHSCYVFLTSLYGFWDVC